MKFNFNTICIYLAGYAPLLVFFLVVMIDRQRRKRMETPPQEEMLLRPPGHSLALRLDEAFYVVIDNILFACVFTAAAGPSVVACAQLFGGGIWNDWTLLCGAILVTSISAGCWLSVKAFRELRKADNLRLALRGEQAVAEKLHELGDCGLRAFHDFPGGKDWNINHVVVGTRGVFMIETKARRRRGSQNGKPAHVVMLERDELRFPTGKDGNAIPQAERNAKNLAAYLAKKTGESVKVEPLVVLPGWYVESGGKNNVKAMNTTYLEKYLRGKSDCLETKQVKRIIAALDEKCRDVEF